MTVKQLLADVARLVFKGELADKLDNQTTLSQDEKRDLDLLLKGYNLIQSEVAAEHLSLTAEDRKFGKLIYFSSFSHAPLSIISATNDRGDEILFTAYQDRVKFERENWYRIRYSYIPDKKTVNDTFDYEKTKVGERAFLYGTASEYCLICGRYEEAAN
ncbi:MAG: hypothetical protein J5836_03220, partial [Clostridia bacterium]|nr:hypothetical protein [Clostridia bacterium]